MADKPAETPKKDKEAKVESRAAGHAKLVQEHNAGLSDADVEYRKSVLGDDWDKVEAPEEAS